VIRVLAAAGVKSDSVGILDRAILDQWEIPFGAWVDQMVDWIDLNLDWLLDAIRWPFSFLLNNFVDGFLTQIPWLFVVIATMMIGALVRTPKVGISAGVALALCGLLGPEYWLETIRTIGMVFVAVLLCAIVGIPLGIACGRIDAVWNVVRPVLDAMQVVHAFVYMLPVIFFWSIGVVPGTMVTMVFALPPLIRLTNLGIRQVPEEVVEASRAFGATELRVLTDVQLPLARPALMTGLNQTLLMSIAMIGIAAIMGAGGLGRLVYKAVQNFDIAASASSGLALFLVAVVLDRLSQPEESDGGNLMTRIGRAWAHRVDPSELLADAEAAVKKSKVEADHGEHDAPASVKERPGLALVGIGGVLAVVSVFMTWGNDAGRLSGHARFADLDLTGQSFDGLHASGGTWVGYTVLACGAFLVTAAAAFLRRPGSGSRWFSADGTTLASLGLLMAVLTYLTVRSAPDTVSYSHGTGVYVAAIGALIALAGSLFALWTAPYAPLRPLRPGIAWGRIATAAVAMIVIGIGSISGWTFDERLSGELTAADVAEVEALRAEAKADPHVAAINTLRVGKIYNNARLSSLVILDGLTEDGGGLGRLALFAGALASLFVLPASGVLGSNEHLRWRWSAVVAGLGFGIMLLGVGWVASLLRVGPRLIVTGAGAFLTILGGFFLLATARPLLAEFRRKKVYDDDVGSVAGEALASVQ